MNKHRDEDERLASWKEIGAYLERDARTVRRWEKQEGLPVHRHAHGRGSSVYAYRSEIDAWRASRTETPEPPPPLPLWRALLTPPRALAFGATLALCLLMVGNGIRPQEASAQSGPPAERQIWVVGDEEPNGPPSADARYIGYTDWATGDLGIRDLVSGLNRKLTNTGGWVKSGDYPEGSVISPDGKLLAYLWYVDHTNTFDLRVIPTAGGTPRTVYRGASGDDYMFPYSWTPDGKQILVVHAVPERASQITLLSIEDGSRTVIKSLDWQDSSVQLSPDGRYIAYDRPVDETTNARDIFLLAVDGSSEVPLVEHPANDARPMWAPDGRQILFESSRTGPVALWTIPVDGGKPGGPPMLTQVDLSRRTPLGISSNGNLFTFSRRGKGANVYVADLNPDGDVIGSPRAVAQRFVNANRGPAVSPNGEYLAYFSQRPGSGTAIVVRTLKTGQERDLTFQNPRLPPLRNAQPMWFPDNASVLVRAEDGRRPGTNFLRVKLNDGSTESLLHVGNRRAYALSPDGESIYFTESAAAGEPASPHLVRFDIATKRKTILESGAQADALEMAISPDGRQLARLVSDRESNGRSSRLEVLPAEGGPPRLVYQDSPWLDGSRFDSLTWTADGRSLLFVRGGVSGKEPQVLWRVPVSGGEPVRAGISRAGNIKSPAVSPDGHSLFFTGSESSPRQLWVLQNFLTAAPQP